MREWHDDLGWGVLDSPATPGGCWAHCSAIHRSGYATLPPGAEATFEFEVGAQHGFGFRATAIWPGAEAGPPYQSTLSSADKLTP